MDFISAPDTLDVQDFQFKLHRRIQIFDASVKVQPEPLDLVATASPLGLLFIGSPDKTLRVLQLKDVIGECDKNCRQRIIQLPSIPVNVSLNCNCDLLSIVVSLNDVLVVLVYNTKSLITENPTIQSEIRLSPTPNAKLCRLLWNPCQPDSLAVCMSDGSLSAFICKSTSVELQTKTTNARCLSWSPKGKQIVTGDSDGTLNQYKPDLTLVKTIPAAKFFDKGTTSALAIHWISNYQFCVVFQDSSNSENRPCVAIVNTPKNGPITYINYDDICYSMGDCRENQFFLLHLSMWGVILASSANSMEIGVLGTSDQNNWQQWTQIDEARAELPLNDDKQESYPIGISLDNSAIMQLPWVDGQTLPHMPMLHILSHSGMLISYFVINLSQNAPNICIVPETLNIPQNLFTMNIYQNIEKQKTPPITSNFQDSVAPNIITSTPTIPKPVPSGTIKPVSTNLFGKIIEESLPKNNSDLINRTPQVHSSNLPIKNNNTNLFNETKSEKPIVQENQNKFIPQPIKQEIVPPNDIKNIVQNNSNKTIKSSERSFESVIKSVPSEVIKSMLLSEVNSFQKDFFELLQKCKRVNIEIGNAAETNKISTVLSSKDKRSTKSNWSDEDMKKQMAMLKHNLINTCAFLAEARMQPASLELEQLAQLDPVSTSKMNSIKLTMYYIESQLRQVNSVLDEQWETFQDECRKKSLAISGSSNDDCMKIPSLEKIYQPLLKQSEILTKQQSMITSLQNTIDGMDLSSISKNSKKNTSSINIKDNNDKNKSLSLLASGINNLNLKSGNLTTNRNNSKLTPSKAKYDSLRKILSNHNTVTIKSVKIEPPSMLQSFHDWNSANKIETKLPENNKTSKIQDSSFDTNKTSTKIIENIKTNVTFSQSNKVIPNVVSNNSPLNFGELISKTNKQNETKFKSPEPSISFTSSEIPKESSLPKPSTAFIFQNIFGKTTSGEDKSISSKTISFPSSTSPSIAVPTAVSSISKTPTIPATSSFKVLTPSPVTGFTAESSVKPEIKEASQSTSLIKDMLKPTETVAKSPVSTLNFSIPASSAPAQLKNFSFSFAPAISSAFSAAPSTTFSSKNLPPVNQPNTQPNTEIKPFLKQPAVSILNSNANTVVSTNSSFLAKISPNVVSSAPQNIPFDNSFKVTSSNTPSSFNLNFPSISTQKDNDKPVTTTPNSVINNLTKSSNLNIVPPNVSISLNSPLPTDLTKSSDQTVDKKIEPPKTAIPITSETIAIPIDKSLSQVSFGSSKIPETPATITTTAPISAFTPTTTTISFSSSAPNVFSATPASSLTISPTQTPTTQVSVFGSPQQVTASFSTLGMNTGSMFGTPNSTASVNPQNIFKSPTTVNTCASSLFGAANAAIDTSVASLFGNTSISTTNAQSPFGNNSSTTNSIFGGQTTFSTTSNSIFGGNSSTFGQPQTNVFGGSATFGTGFGTPSQSSNIFGQAVQSTNNTFGMGNSANQTSMFGSSPFSSNTFGTPASPPQQSVFGSPTTLAAPVFGGSPTFGSKPAFGQAPSFGSSPQGAFGMFSANDQSASSPGAFNKPSGSFGGSPKFGGSPSFGSPPAFGATPSFGGNVNNSFGSPPGFGTGSQQSSTFESLASQSTLSFGNLAQQTQQPQQAPPIFQSSSSFSTWR